jgi:hypothetical protein
MFMVRYELASPHKDIRLSQVAKLTVFKFCNYGRGQTHVYLSDFEECLQLILLLMRLFCCLCSLFSCYGYCRTIRVVSVLF